MSRLQHGNEIRIYVPAGIAGVSRLVKMEPGFHKTAVPQAALCPNCGKLEWFLPPEKIPHIKEI